MDTVAVAQPLRISFGRFCKTQWPGSRRQLDVWPQRGPCEVGLSKQWLLSLRHACDFILLTYACDEDSDVDLSYLVVAKFVTVMEQFVVLAPVDSCLLS